MSKASWIPLLTKALTKLSPKSDLAQFRNEYSEIVRSVNGDSKNVCRKLLLEAAPLVEGWNMQDGKCPCCALREWSTFYERASEALPVEALTLFAKKLPQMKPGAVDWQPFFFSCQHRPIVATIYDRRFIGKAALQSWISDKLQDAYLLPLLDVAIENDAILDYRALWNGCLKWADRPAGLCTRVELLVICYSREPAGSLDKDLSAFLMDNASARKPFFKSALGLPQLYCRLTELLATAVVPDHSDKDSRVEDFVDVCTERARVAPLELPQVMLALASLRLSLTAKGGSRNQASNRTKVVDAASMQLALSVLGQVEEDPASVNGDCLATLSAVQLHDIVHRHLASLATASSSESGPADRSSKYERHLGKKEVLSEVLNALNEGTCDDSLRDALDVALFNLGVRQLGSVGERARFESRLHQALESGIIPGDIVQIVDAGRCLGKGDDLLVLVKAKVQRISG